jgi:hypothetical protein
MKIVRAAGLAGLVLAAGALPVTAYALSSAEDPTPPPAVTQHADTADDPETDATESDTPETDAPETDNPETDSPDAAEADGQPNPASTPGREHAAAMQAWAHCVGEAASGPKTPGQAMPPKLACGDKPLAPGRAKHQTSVTPDASVAPERGPAKAKGHGQARGHAKAHGKGH